MASTDKPGLATKAVYDLSCAWNEAGDAFRFIVVHCLLGTNGQNKSCINLNFETESP